MTHGRGGNQWRGARYLAWAANEEDDSDLERDDNERTQDMVLEVERRNLHLQRARTRRAGSFLAQPFYVQNIEDDDAPSFRRFVRGADSWACINPISARGGPRTT